MFAEVRFILNVSGSRALIERPSVLSFKMGRRVNL